MYKINFNYILNIFSLLIFNYSILSFYPNYWWLYYVLSIPLLLLGFSLPDILEFKKNKQSFFPHNTITYWPVTYFPLLIIIILLIFFIKNMYTNVMISLIVGIYFKLLENLLSDKGIPLICPKASCRYSFNLWKSNELYSYVFDIFIISLSFLLLNMH